METFLLVLAGALWVLLPVYMANAGATFPRGWGPRLDLGRTWPSDGRPILGKSKTWSGLIVGGLFGTLMGLIPAYLILIAPPSLRLVPEFGPTLALSALTLALLAFGALVGDALGSFIKRRLGRPSSSPTPLLDQLPFVIVPLLLLAGLDPSLFIAAFWPSPEAGIIALTWVVVLTLFLHTSFNWVGFFMGTKKVPW